MLTSQSESKNSVFIFIKLALCYLWKKMYFCRTNEDTEKQRKKMLDKLKNLKVGVALSGGGAKGIVHLGVLKALEDRDFRIDMLSGVSAGGIMAALYADGNKPEDICRFIKKSNLYKMVSFSMPTKGGLTNMDDFQEFLQTMLKAKTFEDLKIPLWVNATELNEGRNVYFHTGELLNRLIASASVPLFFRPKILDGKAFVDGGFFCNMPAEKLKRCGCDLVIGVHCNPINYHESNDGFWNVAERVFHLAINGNTIEQKKYCDIVIETLAAQDYGMFEAEKADELYTIGYEAALEALDKFDWDEFMTNRKISRQIGEGQ